MPAQAWETGNLSFPPRTIQVEEETKALGIVFECDTWLHKMYKCY